MVMNLLFRYPWFGDLSSVQSPWKNYVLCFLAGIKSRNSYSFGDQYVHFNVSIPTNLTPRQRELIEEFAKEEQGEIEKHVAVGATG
ncbi:hypothetical protein SLEP1_g36680 [Rubroshorea leprosula]|uniref:Uncharacterized protein n=1 Tax=Rubroshorea leprosula TaxID=152421 RepID=A0AAV5KSE2_9ROSI|nr:hypothetical protein SLEP1_g36680 [Rubroshorea leprosula]